MQNKSRTIPIQITIPESKQLHYNIWDDHMTDDVRRSVFNWFEEDPSRKLEGFFQMFRIYSFELSRECFIWRFYFVSQTDKAIFRLTFNDLLNKYVDI